MDSLLLTRTALARLLGISRQAVHQKFESHKDEIVTFKSQDTVFKCKLVVVDFKVLVEVQREDEQES